MSRIHSTLSAWIISTSLVVGLLYHSSAVFAEEIGGDRSVMLRVPNSYDPRVPAPVLLYLHGRTGDPEVAPRRAQFGPVAEAHGILYAEPDGLPAADGFLVWTDFGNDPGMEEINAAYLVALIEEIQSLYAVDRDRIFLAGHSNGGAMSYFMACERPDLITAFASTSSWNRTSCTAQGPVHALEVHGTSDSTVPYDSGVLSIKHWAEESSCTSSPVTSEELFDLIEGTPGLDTSITRYPGCDSGATAELWTVRGGEHIPTFTPQSGTTRYALHVTDWLLSHPRRPRADAAFTVTPSRGVAPLEVLLDGSASVAPEGTAIDGYYWFFAVGQGETGRTLTRSFDEPGRHTVALSVVTDDDRVSVRSTQPVVALCPGGTIAPWVAADVGSPDYPGAAWFSDGETEALEVCAGGTDIAGISDEHFFVYQEVSGDVRFTTKWSGFEPTSLGAKVGVMIRDSLDEDATFVGVVLESSSFSDQVRFLYRPGSGEPVKRSTKTIQPEWLRIERRGMTIAASYSEDGESWVPLGEQEIPMPEAILVGVAAVGKDVEPTSSFEPLRVQITELELVPLREFLRGDCNADGAVNVSDASCILNWLFAGGESPGCVAATNTNGDPATNITDATYLLNFLFAGGPAPLAPFPDCGPGMLPADGGLGCANPPACQ